MQPVYVEAMQDRNAARQALLKNVLARMQLPPTLSDPASAMGPDSSMLCPCGGALHDDVEAHAHNQAVLQGALNPPKPYHRKKRTLKKRLRAWRVKQRLLQSAACIAESVVGGRPALVCAQCHRREGRGSAVLRNLWQTEPVVLQEFRLFGCGAHGRLGD